MRLAAPSPRVAPSARAPALPRARRAVRASASATDLPPPFACTHLLVTLVDASPSSLSDGSRSALAAAGALTRARDGARLTVLLVDVGAPPPPDAGDARTRAVGAALEAAGVASDRVDYLEKALTDEAGHCAAAAAGDAADGVGADLLLVSSDAVHAKAIDANLLAEFCDCPVLLLP